MVSWWAANWGSVVGVIGTLLTVFGLYLSGEVTLKSSTLGMTEHDQVTVKGSHSLNLFFGVAYDTLVASVWTFDSRRRRR